MAAGKGGKDSVAPRNLLISVVLDDAAGVEDVDPIDIADGSSR